MVEGRNNIIAFRITAVPERMRNALKEAVMIGVPEDCIYIDSEHKGSVWNKFRIYQELIDQSFYTHVCMNDDDMILPANYKELVQTAVDRFPDSILTFYNSKVYSKKPAFFDMKSHYMNGTACVIPIKYLRGFLDFYHDHLNGFLWDDTAVSIYALLNDIQVLLFSPKIIDVIRVPSTIKMRKGKYQPHNIGYTPNVRCEDMRNAEIIPKRGRLNLHLPECELRQMCINKMNEEAKHGQNRSQNHSCS